MPILEKLNQLDNADKISKKQPISNLYDMYFHISRQKTPDAVFGMSIFDSILRIPKYYLEDENPKNKLLLHGIVFNSILKVYKQYLEIYNTDDLTLIDKEEYKSMPKLYRSIFVKYDDNHYKLNHYKKDVIITISNGKQERVAEIIKEIERILPIIYQTKQRIPDMIFGGLEIYEGNEPIVSPKFVKNDLSANFIDDNSFYAYTQLHDLFVELAQITMPRLTNIQRKKKSDGALELYNEYQDALTRKNSVLFAHKIDVAERTATEQFINAKAPTISEKEMKKLVKQGQCVTAHRNIAKWEYSLYNKKKQLLLHNLKRIISIKTN
ncbi:MAG: hypothetical protein IKZ49_00390 [Alphaproteobacteria bacterium]|nr:hypothetical protein [Alphaproteobacteria bacterium]